MKSIAIINESSVITDAQLAAVNCQHQDVRDFRFNERGFVCKRDGAVFIVHRDFMPFSPATGLRNSLP